MTPELRTRPRRHARARRRLRGRVRRPRPRPPGRDDRQPGELHALHAAAARSRGREHRAAPRDGPAAHDVPARRPPPRLGRRAGPRAQGRQRLLGGRGVRGRLRAAGDRARVDHAHAARPGPAGVLARPQGHRRRDPAAQPRAAPDRARRRGPGLGAASPHVRLRRRRLRGCRSRRRAPGTDRRCAPAASATRGCPAPLGLGRLGAAHPRAGAREPRGVRRADARAARRGDPPADRARFHRPQRRRAVRRPSDRDRDRRLDGRRRCQSRRRPARVAARRARPDPGRRALQGRGPGRRARAWRHRRRAERRHRQLRPADLSARAAPGAPPVAQPARARQAVRVQEPRLDGHARPPPRHRDRRGRSACAGSSAGASRAATTCWRCPSTRAERACSRTGPPRPASAAMWWSSRHEVALANCSCSRARISSTTPAAASRAARWTSRSPTPTG